MAGMKVVLWAASKAETTVASKVAMSAASSVGSWAVPTAALLGLRWAARLVVCSVETKAVRWADQSAGLTAALSVVLMVEQWAAEKAGLWADLMVVCSAVRWAAQRVALLAVPLAAEKAG